jgi:hypothetical protein
MQNSRLNSLLAGNLRGDWCDQHCVASQPVRRMETLPFLSSESPPMAGFCKLAIGLRAQKLAASGTKSPIVSGGYLKYSRFRETGTGDRVRSALRGRAGKFAAGVSRYLCVKSGVSDVHCATATADTRNVSGQKRPPEGGRGSPRASQRQPVGGVPQPRLKCRSGPHPSLRRTVPPLWDDPDPQQRRHRA